MVYFSKALGGKEMSFEEIIRKDRSDACAICPDVDFDEVQFLNALPSHFDMSNYYARINPKKVTGENGIGGKLIKRFPRMFASLYYGVNIKSVLRLKPPIQSKGGMLHHLLKAGGAPTLPKGYRDIMLGNITEKNLNKIIRNNLMPVVRQIAGNGQFASGINGGETAGAHLYIKMVLDIAKLNNISACILFVDVVNAFGSMLRRVIFDFSDGDELWLKQRQNAGFKNTDIKQIYQVVCKNVWHNHCLQKHSQFKNVQIPLLMAQSFYNNTWFTQEGIPGAVHTVQGCSAGMPMADIIFGIVLSRVLELVAQALVDQQLSSEISARGVIFPLAHIAFADDVAAPVVGPAASIVNKVACCASVYFTIFASFGLSINFGIKKSEAIVSFAGKGSKIAKRLLYRDGNTVTFNIGNHIELRFVPSYKHLGSKTTANCNDNCEVVTRCAIIRKGAGAFNRVFKNPNIQCFKKVNVAKTYVFTSGLFQCGTWSIVCSSSQESTSIYHFYLSACHKQPFQQ